MAATAELALLPMISPVRVEMLTRNPARDNRPRLSQQPRIYRLPPKARNTRFSYCANGYSVLQNAKGRIINLYA